MLAVAPKCFPFFQNSVCPVFASSPHPKMSPRLPFRTLTCFKHTFIKSFTKFKNNKILFGLRIPCNSREDIKVRRPRVAIAFGLYALQCFSCTPSYTEVVQFRLRWARHDRRFIIKLARPNPCVGYLEVSKAGFLLLTIIAVGMSNCSFVMTFWWFKDVPMRGARLFCA